MTLILLSLLLKHRVPSPVTCIAESTGLGQMPVVSCTKSAQTILKCSELPECHTLRQAEGSHKFVMKSAVEL